MNDLTKPNKINNFPWINPVGGFGDMLMLSGVLKLVHDQDPQKRFNLTRRTNYLSILKGHPAISKIGFPPKDVKVIGVDYWSKEELGPGENRAFQVLARVFGLETPVEEKLYIPDEKIDDKLLDDFIPWKKLNVVIAPASDSPRKMMDPKIWHHLVDKFHFIDALVIQVGRLNDQHIKNTYSLLGLTTPRQLIALLRKIDLVITMDNFIMHATHHVNKPCVVLWGATHHKIYGYDEQIHLQMKKTCDLSDEDECIGASINEGGKLYGTPCPIEGNHCMNQATPELIFGAAQKALLNFKKMPIYLA